VSSKNREEYVWLHIDSENVEEREDGVYVRCPNCGTWNHSHQLQHDGCSCGATASTWMKFEWTPQENLEK